MRHTATDERISRSSPRATDPAGGAEVSSDQELASGIWDGQHGRFGTMQYRMGDSSEHRLGNPRSSMCANHDKVSRLRGIENPFGRLALDKL